MARVSRFRIGLSWACYWLGDLFWKYGADAWPGDHWEFPYRIYNRLMIWSSDLQGDDQRGPWKPHAQEEK